MPPDPGRLFCSRPFEYFETTQLKGRGGVYLCCSSWLDTPVGNVREQSVEEIWNGPVAQEIRRSILDGSFEFCDHSTCPYLQTRAEPVQPVEDVKDPDFRRAIEEELTVLPYGPRKIICTYDQSCNLSCPTCRTEVMIEHDGEEAILDIQRKLEDEGLREARLLHITGSGDPFGSPFFRRWLQTMRRENMPRLENIHLHTNAQLWTPRTWETIDPEIRALIRSAEISVDAARAETYAVNRRGGSFERLLQNLAFIRTLRLEGPLESVKLSMVVQANNFREMPEFVELTRRFGFDLVYFGQLVNWGTFTEEEFGRRAVHLPGHAEHPALLEVLECDVFNDPMVDLGNLTATARLREGAPGRAAGS